MTNHRFRYNAQTLRFERIRISFWNVTVSILSVLSISALFFFGLLYLQQRVVWSESKRHYVQENDALLAQHEPMRRQVDTLRHRLALVARRESALFSRLFGMDKPESSSPLRAGILSIDQEQFHRSVGHLINQVDRVRQSATASDRHFAQTILLTKQDVSRLKTLPTLFPVHDLQVHQVVSGFGSRINPWHKGHYDHHGIDITQPREAPVLATASGVVRLVKRSDLLAGYGNHIEIDHENGFVTRYAHLGEITVRTEQRIEQGFAIARVGMSGSSVAPHVHYEVLWHGQPIDPLRIIAPGKTDAAALAAVRQQAAQYNQALD